MLLALKCSMSLFHNCSFLQQLGTWLPAWGILELWEVPLKMAGIALLVDASWSSLGRPSRLPKPRYYTEKKSFSMACQPWLTVTLVIFPFQAACVREHGNLVSLRDMMEFFDVLCVILMNTQQETQIWLGASRTVSAGIDGQITKTDYSLTEWMICSTETE